MKKFPSSVRGVCLGLGLLACVCAVLSGADSVVVKVTPLDDTVTEATETVVVTLSANKAYTAGTPAVASADIADNDLATAPTPTPTPSATPSPTPTPAGQTPAIYVSTR